MNPQRIAGLLLLAVGIVLLVFGIRATESFGSQFVEFFKGTPTDRAIWFILGGCVAIVLGLVAVAMPSFRRAQGGHS